MCTNKGFSFEAMVTLALLHDFYHENSTVLMKQNFDHGLVCFHATLNRSGEWNNFKEKWMIVLKSNNKSKALDVSID